MADGDGVPHAGLRRIGGYHDDFGAQGQHGFYQVTDAGGGDTVVVGDENEGLFQGRCCEVGVGSGQR